MKHHEKPAQPATAPVLTEKQRKLDRQLDEALEETFPGSDPVAVSQPAPDDRHFALPMRKGHEPVAAYLERIAHATDVVRRHRGIES